MSDKINLLMDQAATFSQEIDLLDDNNDPLVTTGYSANASMKKSYQAANVIYFDCSLDIGKVVLSMDASNTAAIVPGRYVYDVILTKAPNVSRIVEGIVTVRPAVTIETNDQS
jgi:hypothetical protein